MEASDSSTITANVAAAWLAVAVSLGGAASADAIASNTIDNKVLAAISDTSVTSVGDVTIKATESASITAYAIAASFAGGSFAAVSGGGASAVNTITTDTEAYVASTVSWL